MERNDLFDIYDDTVVTVWDGHGWVDPADVCTARGQGAVVLTAWNPGWERPERPVNDAANLRLQKDLEALGVEVWPAVGASRHDDHSEPGFIAWGMDGQSGCAVARRFGQFAIYVYDAQGTRLTLDCA